MGTGNIEAGFGYRKFRNRKLGEGRICAQRTGYRIGTDLKQK